jgi:hypothetical protein
MSARDVIREALILNSTRSTTTKTQAVERALHRTGYRILAPGELDDVSIEAAARVADEHAAGAGIVSHEASSAALEELPDAIRALKASPTGTEGGQ